MLQLDYMTDDGAIHSKEILDEHYMMALRMFRTYVTLRRHQLVYLWLSNEGVLGDQVQLERWVRK